MVMKLVVGVVCMVLLIGGFVAAGAASVNAGVTALASGRGGCVPSGVSVAATVPAELALTNATGGTLTLGATQLRNASRMLATARSLNISDKGLTIMMITVMQESMFWLYANTAAPDSLDYPHDKVGSDHDSVNPFQQRGNWGSVEERMDLSYATEAFFGGPSGPNGGSPAGLLDKAGWEAMSPGDAAQAVQVSAFPDAYEQWIPAARTLLDSLGGRAGASGCSGASLAGGAAVMPLTTPFSMTSDFGYRGDIGLGTNPFHAAVDLQNWPNPCGQPVFAMMEGTVTESSRLFLSIKHPDGFEISYLHTHKSGRMVDVGATVAAGQQIAAVGNEAPSTGCHLDVRIDVSENTDPRVAALPSDAPNAPGWVSPEDFFALFGLTLCPADWCQRQY